MTFAPADWVDRGCCTNMIFDYLIIHLLDDFCASPVGRPVVVSNNL